MLKRKSLLFLAFFCGLLSAVVGCGSSPTTHPSVLAPQIWQLQSNQTFMKGLAGTFSVKWIDITSKEFLFFYVFSSSHQGNLQVTASTSLESRPETALKLTTEVQILGQLGTYTVGVVHVSRSSHSGQIITLHITPPGEKIPLWHIMPLKQLEEEPQEATSQYGLYCGASGLPELRWYGPVKEQQVAYFENSISSQGSSSKSYIFLQISGPATVSTISETEYLSIAGANNLSS